MGLDHAVLIARKGEQPEGALMVFRKHDRLHGFMERLSYQKGLVDPFDQVEVDWDEIEKEIQKDLEAQIEMGTIMTPTAEEINNPETQTKKAEFIQIQPTMDLSPYTKGRLVSDTLVPLTEEDFGYLIEALSGYMQADSEEERNEYLPPCKGLFFGESSDDEWVKTFAMIHGVYEQFGFDDYEYYYHCEW